MSTSRCIVVKAAVVVLSLGASACDDEEPTSADVGDSSEALSQELSNDTQSSVGTSPGLLASHVGTSPEPETSEPSGSPPTPGDPAIDPISRIAGYDVAAMSDAVVRAQVEYVAECMADRGFDYDTSTNLLTGALVGTEAHVQDVIKMIESETVSPSASPSQGDPNSEAAELECTSEAEQRLPNPNGTVLTILSEFNEDVSDRSASDQRVIEAGRRRDECITATGYAVEPGVNGLSAVARDADTILQDYQAGNISKQAALDQLYRLLPIEAALLECSVAYSNVAAVVSAEAWDEVIDANPGLLEEVRRAAAEQVAMFEEYL